MKKEIFAVSLLLILFAGSLINIYFLNRLTGDLTDLVIRADESASKEDWGTAQETAEAAAEKWNRYDSYTHIFLKHSEIDSATDAFYELLENIYAQDAGGARGAAQKLTAHLTSLATMERIRLGSIF
jgi:hypothetical protein